MLPVLQKAMRCYLLNESWCLTRILKIKRLQFLQTTSFDMSILCTFAFPHILVFINTFLCPESFFTSNDVLLIYFSSRQFLLLPSRSTRHESLWVHEIHNFMCINDFHKSLWLWSWCFIALWKHGFLCFQGVLSQFSRVNKSHRATNCVIGGNLSWSAWWQFPSHIHVQIQK